MRCCDGTRASPTCAAQAGDRAHPPDSGAPFPPLGHPVAGDELYGPQKAIKRLQGQCLHARALGFTHPVTGERLYFESQLPEYFTSFLKTLRPKEDLSNGERTDF